MMMLAPCDCSCRKLASYAGTLNPWLDARVAAGQLSPEERDVLWAAARDR